MATEPEIHALVVGIDFYLPQQVKEAPVFPSLGGCVHDARAMRDFLLRTGAAAENIELLTATPLMETDERPEEPPEQQPTHANLVAALERLVGRAAPGRQIVLHYSGHGGVAVSQNPEKVTRGLATDECLVPLDIGASADVPYLRDWELAVSIRRMVERGAAVTLLLDCCHSGGLLRSKADFTRPRPRGTAMVDSTARPPSSLLTEAADEVAATVRGVATRGGRAGMWQPVSKGFALLAACGPQQQAMEAAFSGRQPSGAMTYWLLDALAAGGQEMSYRELHQRLLGRIHNQFPTQTPMLEGEVDRRFLGLERVPVLHGAAVLRGEEDGEGPLLGMGSLHAVGPGARFAVYPAGLRSEEQLEGARLAVVRLTEVGVDQSPAEVVERSEAEGEEARPLAVGDRAVLLDAGDVRLRRPVRWMGPDGSESQWEALRECLEEEEVSFLSLESEDGSVGLAEGFEVHLDERGGYRLCADGGAPLPDVPVVADPDKVVEFLTHLARFRNIHGLRNTGRGTPLDNKVCLQVWRRPPDWPEDDFTSPDSDGGWENVAVGDYLYFEVTNHSPQALNVAILDLQPGWSIEQLYPSPQSGMLFDVVDPGQSLKTWVQLYLPRKFERPVDTFKVVAAFDPIDLRAVELPALGQEYRFRGGVRGAADSLQNYLDSMAAEPPRMRHARPPKREGSWIVKQVEVRIARG